MLRRNLQIRLLSWITNNFPKDNAMIQEKTHHTMEVCNAINRIATAEKLDAGDYDVAIMIGLLHDVGRFPQIMETGSFRDSDEFDHAKEGARMLKEGLLKELLPETRMFDRLLIEVVENHSKIVLPDTMDPITRMFSEILRDADRVDLFRTCIGDFDVLFWASNENEYLTPDIKEDFILRQPMKVENCHSNLDLLALRVGLLYQYKFSGVWEFVKKQNYIQRLEEKFVSKLGKYYNSEDINLIFNNAEEFLALV